MKKRLRVYICGPITGIPGGNFTTFEDAEYMLHSLGYNTVNPHDICAHLDQSSSHKEFMAVCLPELLRCDIVATLPGFEDSKGCKMEVDIARQYEGEIDVVNIFKLSGIKEDEYLAKMRKEQSL